MEAVEIYQALDFDDLQEMFNLNYTELIEILRKLEGEREIFVDWTNRVVKINELGYEDERYDGIYWSSINEEERNLEIFLVRRRLRNLNSVLRKIKNFALITPSLDISLTCSPK